MRDYVAVTNFVLAVLLSRDRVMRAVPFYATPVMIFTRVTNATGGIVQTALTARKQLCAMAASPNLGGALESGFAMVPRDPIDKKTYQSDQ